MRPLRISTILTLLTFGTRHRFFGIPVSKKYRVLVSSTLPLVIYPLEIRGRGPLTSMRLGTLVINPLTFDRLGSPTFHPRVTQ